MRQFTLSILVAILGCVICTNPCAADPKPKDSTKKSLDDALLDDLDSDLLDGLGDDIPTKTTDKPQSSKTSDVDQDLLDQIGEGEDVELGKKTDPLTRIGKRMRTAERLIAGRDTSEKTQRLQKEILEDLAALIDVQKKRAAQANGQRKKRPGNGNVNPEAGSSAGPERSTPRVGKTDVIKKDLTSQQDLYKKTWGKLPKRRVEEMLNSNIESFLPKYAKLIEEYFIRLAEESR